MKCNDASSSGNTASRIDQGDEEGDESPLGHVPGEEAGEALEEVSEGDLRQREALQLVIDSRGLLEGR